MNRQHTIYMPDGKPAPPVLTEQEAIKLLRLDTIALKHPESTLRRYRDMGLLRCVQISKKVLYPLDELMEFVERQKEAVAR